MINGNLITICYLRCCEIIPLALLLAIPVPLDDMLCPYCTREVSFV